MSVLINNYFLDSRFSTFSVKKDAPDKTAEENGYTYIMALQSMEKAECILILGKFQ
jgi:hypothetical protein